MTAVVVLGAGELGGAVARTLAASGVANRVTIVDDAVDVARGKALDIHQAGALEAMDAEVVGSADLAAVVGAAAIVLADRHGPAPSEWTGEDGLQRLARVRALNPLALIVCAGATQLDLVERAVIEQASIAAGCSDRRPRHSGRPPSRSPASRPGADRATCR